MKNERPDPIQLKPNTSSGSENEPTVIIEKGGKPEVIKVSDLTPEECKKMMDGFNAAYPDD